MEDAAQYCLFKSPERKSGIDHQRRHADPVLPVSGKPDPAAREWSPPGSRDMGNTSGTNGRKETGKQFLRVKIIVMGSMLNGGHTVLNRSRLCMAGRSNNHRGGILPK